MITGMLQKAKSALAPTSGKGIGKFLSSPFKEVGRLGIQQLQKYDPSKDTFAEYCGRLLPINVLYDDPISKAGRMAPARIGSFIFFGQTSQSINETQKITSHPIAEGGVMADHVYREPVRISVSGLVFESYSNILEKAWMNKKMDGPRNLIEELKRGGIPTLTALRRVVNGYQKRKLVVDTVRALLETKGDFRFTFESNLVTYTHMAIQSLSIKEGLDTGPVEIAMELVQVKQVKLGQVDAGYFDGVKRKKVVQKGGGVNGVGDSGTEKPGCTDSDLLALFGHKADPERLKRYKAETCK